MDYRDARSFLLANSKEEPGPLETDCLVWQGPRHVKGYSYVRYQGYQWYVHRLSFTAFNERDIEEGAWILHHCDNPVCIETSHIFEGDAQRNVDDMWERGRANPACKLSASEVREIKLLGIANELTAEEVANVYSVSREQISGIWRCKIRRDTAADLNTLLLERRPIQRRIATNLEQRLRKRIYRDLGIHIQ
jgi:hypothetical protein